MCLLKTDCLQFSQSEIQATRDHLLHLDENQRIEYRNRNATEIAKCSSDKILIVSGPGTGKSHLFMSRIQNWFDDNSDISVLVTSFVRKLISDLDKDVQLNDNLSDGNKKKISIITLHRLARSLVEKNNGSSEWPLADFFKMIGQEWKKEIWSDVLEFYPSLDNDTYSEKAFNKQLYDNSFEETTDWQGIKDTYFQLCRLYNASGFADLIIRATAALKENPTLSFASHFIVDEHQDFNQAEQDFIMSFTGNAISVLIVGDDEQVLYEELKSSKPELIRELYDNDEFTKAMLPFCGRCGYHIVKCSEAFIAEEREPETIEKLFLPLLSESDSSKVQIIACPNSGSAIQFIEEFITDNHAQIEKRKEQLESDDAKDPFLLILAGSAKLNFFGPNKEQIFDAVSKYKHKVSLLSQDYYMLLTYYALGINYIDNFNFRKVMFYESLSRSDIHKFLEEVIELGQNFADLEDEKLVEIKNKCEQIKSIMDSEYSEAIQVKELSKLLEIGKPELLIQELISGPISERRLTNLVEAQEVQYQEFGKQQMSAIELMSIVGSKGLSADHVIIIGFDNQNMKWISSNAFYVAMTRARKSLQLVTALKCGGSTFAHPYIAYLPHENVDYYKYKKSEGKKIQLSGRTEFDNYLKSLNFYKKVARRK